MDYEVKTDKDIEALREYFVSGIRSGEIYGSIGEIVKDSKCSEFSFHITNRKHSFRRTDETAGGRMPVFVYLNGRVLKEDGRVKVRSSFWYGLRLLEIIFVFIASFLLLFLLKNIAYNDVSMLLVTISALVITLFGTVFSFICSMITSLGNLDRNELDSFISRLI